MEKTSTGVATLGAGDAGSVPTRRTRMSWPPLADFDLFPDSKFSFFQTGFVSVSCPGVSI